MQENVVNQRVRAEWRARACAAAAASGALVFCLGAGVAVPLGLNAAWILALPAAGLCALLAARARTLLLRAQETPVPVWRALLLAAVMLACCLLLIAAMVSLAAQTLLVQARSLDCAALTLAFLLLAALPRMAGVSRLCFALRYAQPAGLLVCALAMMPGSAVSGLFPVLGGGPGRAALGAAAMLGAAAPALMLMIPACGGREEMRNSPIPSAGFFALRAGLGALCGAALLLLPSLFGGYAALLGRSIWGERLHICAVNGTQAPLWQTALLLLQLGAISFGACALLCAAEEAVVLAFPRLERRRIGLMICAAVLAAALLVIIFCGDKAALAAAPLIALPIPVLALPPVHRKRNNERNRERKTGRAPGRNRKGKTP